MHFNLFDRFMFFDRFLLNIKWIKIIIMIDYSTVFKDFEGNKFLLNNRSRLEIIEDRIWTFLIPFSFVFCMVGLVDIYTYSVFSLVGLNILIVLTTKIASTRSRKTTIRNRELVDEQRRINNLPTEFEHYPKDRFHYHKLDMLKVGFLWKFKSKEEYDLEVEKYIEDLSTEFYKLKTLKFFPVIVLAPVLTRWIIGFFTQTINIQLFVPLTIVIIYLFIFCMCAEYCLFKISHDFRAKDNRNLRDLLKRASIEYFTDQK